MAINADVLKRLVPISQFNKGQAAQVFDRLHQEKQLVVLKNNVPTAVVLSTDEFSRLSQIEEDYNLLMLAQQRLQNNNMRNAIDEQTLLAHIGLTDKDIEDAEDVEFE